MTFDVHQLDTFVLVGAGVTLLAILAVRVSSRAGLPSLLLYLLMGVALGENGIGYPLRQRRGRPRPRVRGPRRDPRRRRPVDELARGAAVDAARSLPGHARGRRVGDDRGARCALPDGAVVAAVGAPRCGDLADRRGRRVLRAAGSSALAPAGRRPRGGVRAERRADRRPGHAGLDRRRGRPRRSLRAGRHRSSSSSAGLLVGLGGRVRRRVADAASRTAVVGPLPARGAVPRVVGVRRVRGACTRPGSPRSTWPR